MSHVLIVGHADAKPRLQAIATELKRLTGFMVSCYFDGDLDYINNRRELPRVDYLLLGLCRASRNPDSNESRVESDLLNRALALLPRLPCGILCDVNGHVSAPYLVKMGAQIDLVVAFEQNPAANATTLCENAQAFYVEEGCSAAARIAVVVAQRIKQQVVRAA